MTGSRPHQAATLFFAGVLILTLIAPFVTVASAANEDPDPNIAKVDIPSEITIGESFIVDVSGENNGGKAGHWSTITISSPDLDQSDDGSQVAIIDDTDHAYSAKATKGDQIYNKNGNQITANYALAEAGSDGDSYWNAGEQRYFAAKFTPEKTGTFNVYIRVTLTDDEDTSKKFNAPSSSSQTDQQDFYVIRREVNVKEKPNIDAKITDFDQESGTFQPGDKVDATTTVKNTGNREHTFFVGYSVKGPDGEWRDNGDSTGTSATLNPGETRNVALQWTVEKDAPAGSYDAGTAIWKESDRNNLNTKLDAQSQSNAFEVEIPSRIEGQVTDGSGNPLTGAKVYLDDTTDTRTDSNGNYAFPDVSPGSHEVYVTAGACYETNTKTANVDDGETVTKTFRLDAKRYSVHLSSTPISVDASGSGTYDCGTDVQITAPTEKNQYAFDHWERADGSVESTQASFTIDHISRDYDLTAHYTKQISAPSVSTGKASNIQATSATLQGTLDATGGTDAVDVWFKYRKKGASNWQSSSTKRLSSTTGFSIAVSNLNSGTTYEYKAVSENNEGSSEGSTKSFTTGEEKYSISVDLTNSDAQVELDGQTFSTDVKKHFKAGTDVTVKALPPTGYSFDRWEGDYPSGEQSSNSITITMDQNKGLSAYFKESTGNPAVSIDTATGITQHAAQLEGTLDSTGNADPVDVWFEYREKGATTWQTTSKKSLNSAGSFDTDISGLDPGTTYEFRAAAENKNGSDSGDVKTFTTGKPDLDLVDIRWSPKKPKEGEDVAFTVEVRNTGGTPVSDTNLELRLGSDLYQATGIDLDGGETVTVTVTDNWTANPAVNEVTAEIDPNDEIAEEDETNNQGSATVSVGQAVLPPISGISVPKDPDDDGKYEDTNGNGRIDFNDVVILANHLNDPAVTEHTDAYDFDDDGDIDSDDYRQLFKEV